MPHAALWVVQHEWHSLLPAFAGRFQCRTRLCVWCSMIFVDGNWMDLCFNAARGFVCGAAFSMVADGSVTIEVSMPHAALWVVQLRRVFVDL